MNLVIRLLTRITDDDLFFSLLFHGGRNLHHTIARIVAGQLEPVLLGHDEVPAERNGVSSWIFGYPVARSSEDLGALLEVSIQNLHHQNSPTKFLIQTHLKSEVLWSSLPGG